MATLVHTGTQSQATNAASITTNSPSALAGNKLILQVSWLDTNAGAPETLTAPAGWTADKNPTSFSNSGAGGYAEFSKTAAGGVESPVVASPFGSGMYANAIITEWSGMGAHDTADASAIITNSAAASSTGGTVANTGTLAAGSSVVFVGVSVYSGTGLANAAIAFSGGGWTTLVSDQDTSASVGTLMGYKLVASNAALGAVFTWTGDATMKAFQGGITVFSDTAVSTAVAGVTGPSINQPITTGFAA